MAEAAEASNQQIITDANKSPLVEVLVWMLLATSLVSVSVRVVTKISFVRKFEFDDFFIVAATLVSIGQSVAVDVSARAGFGQQADLLDDSKRRAILQSQYAANILNIAVLWFVKLSILAFIRSLTATRIHHQLILGLGVFVVIWAISAIFSVSFLCELPQPWNHLESSCSDRHLIFWKYFGITNIATDAIQVVLVFWIISTLRIKTRRRVALVFVFGARVLVIATTVGQIILLNRVSTSTDKMFDLWPWAIANQAVACISIVTACIPYLKPFLRSLGSGLLRADEFGGLGPSKAETTGGSNSKFGSKLSSKAKETLSSVRGKGREPEKPLEMCTLSPIKHHYVANAVVGERNGSQNWDRESSSSQSRIIRETKSWTINVEQNTEN